MNIDVENFIEGRYRNYLPEGGSSNAECVALYSDFSHEKLRLLFSTIHADLIRLFDRMNLRLPTGDKVGYYWADESRHLIKSISTINILREELENTELPFSVDTYYEGG